MTEEYASARLDRINAILLAVKFRSMKRNSGLFEGASTSAFMCREMNAAEMMEIIDLAKPR